MALAIEPTVPPKEQGQFSRARGLLDLWITNSISGEL